MIRQNKEDAVLIDASKFGTNIKEGKSQKTVLSAKEEKQIIDAFTSKSAIDDFTVVVTKEQIMVKNYSFSAGQYFEIKIVHIDISPEEFEKRMAERKQKLKEYFEQGKKLEKEILANFDKLKLGGNK